MPLGQPNPAAARKPDIEILPDGRKRFTRYRDLAHGGQINDALFPAYGAALDGFDTSTANYAGFADLRLIRQYVSDQLPAPGRDGRPQLVQVYETLPATAEIQVGENAITTLDDGRTAIEAEFLQLNAGSYVPGTIGTTTAPGDSSAYLQRAEATDDGTLRRIKRTYVYAGTLSQTDQTRNNGALLLRTIVAIKTAPSTPSGYTLINQDVKSPNGVPVYTRTYAQGYGTISVVDETRYNGALLLRTIVWLEPAPGGGPSTPSGYTLVSTQVREDDGYEVFTFSFAKGAGLLSKSIQPRAGGLRLETWVSLGATYDSGTMLPPGILVVKDEEQLDGTVRWTVGCIQTLAGGDPTDAYSVTSQAWRPFTYPGRAKAYTDTVSSFTMVDVFLSPPSTSLVLATTTITYQTSTDVGSLTDTLWNPTQWATMRCRFVAQGTAGNARSIVKGLEGYTSEGGDHGVSFTAADPSVTSCLGEPVFYSTSGNLYVSGGPTPPDGSTTYTLHAEVDPDPVFVGLDGTKYYRKIVVTATPAAQASLPV